MEINKVTLKCGGMLFYHAPKFLCWTIGKAMYVGFRETIIRRPLLTIFTPIGTVVLVSGYLFHKTTVKKGTEFIPTLNEETHYQQLRANITRIKRQFFGYMQLKREVFLISLMSGFTINHSSQMIERATTRPGADLRQAFISINEHFRTFPMGAAAAHTHPESAVNRSAMAAFMANVAHQAGFGAYHVSRAKSDQHSGCRYFYNNKDIAIPYSNDAIDDNTALIFTDVDYYADMVQWLKLNKPILMYTLVPTQMSSRTNEYEYHFEGDEVVYHVKGGATYRHRLWSYTGDIVVAEHHGDKYVYNLEQRTVPGDENHRYVCLTPTAHVKYPQSLLMDTEDNDLRRFSNVGYLYDPITDKLSITGSSKHHSINITGKIYNAVKARIANKTAPPIIADIERILQVAGIAESGLVAPLLFNYVDTNIEKNIIFTSTMVTNYHPVVEGAPVTEDGHPMGESASSNLVYPGAAFPTVSIASDIATIRGRVTAPSNNRTPPSDYNTHANDFLSQLIRRPQSGAPWTVHQVELEQDTMMQKARTELIKATVQLDSANALQAFVKAEPYATPNDPRNITTMRPELTVMMSTFTYAFKHDILKQHKFYSPGMVPTEITDRLKEITDQGMGVMLTDYSRFDGSISEWLQKNIVKAAYNRWLNLEHRGEFTKWFNKVFKQTASTRNRIQYSPGWGTRSGSPITTDGNTMINAFIMYVALRKAGFSIPNAFKLLGLYCGDDGFTAYQSGLRYFLEETVRELGLSVELEVRTEGPYPYCGRLFINPSLYPDSFQDLKRTLPKLHLVSNGPESLDQRLTNKASGYAVTDPQTPILGAWAKKVLAITKLDPKHCTHEELFKMRHPWPQTNPEVIMGGVCKYLDMTSIEVQQMINMIEETTSLTTFPVLQEWTPDSKITAVRDDIVEMPRRIHNNGSTVANQNVSTTQEQQTRPQQRSRTPAQTVGAIPTQGENNQPERTENVVPPLAGGSRSSDLQHHRRANQPAQALHRQARGPRPHGAEARLRANPSSRVEPSGSHLGRSA